MFSVVVILLAFIACISAFSPVQTGRMTTSRLNMAGDVLSLTQKFTVCPSQVFHAGELVNSISTLLSTKYGVPSTGFQLVAGGPDGVMIRHSLYENFAQRDEKWQLYKNDAEFVAKNTELRKLWIPETKRDYYRTYVIRSDDVQTGVIRTVREMVITPGQRSNAIQWAKDMNDVAVGVRGKGFTVALASYGVASLFLQSEFSSWKEYDELNSKLESSDAFWAQYAKRAPFFIAGETEKRLYKKIGL